MVGSQATSSEIKMWLGVEYQPPHNSRGPGSRAPIRPRLVGMWSTAMQGHSEVKVTGGYRAGRIRHRIARNGVRGLLIIPDNRDTVGRHGNWFGGRVCQGGI